MKDDSEHGIILVKPYSTLTVWNDSLLAIAKQNDGSVIRF